MITKPTKYTEPFVLETLQDMLKRVKKDKRIVYINQLFEDYDFSRQRFSEWAKSFDNEEISDTIKKIKEITENRLFVGGLNGDINVTMAIFGLKNNHKWTDKMDVTSGDKPLEGGLNLPPIHMTISGQLESLREEKGVQR